MNEQTALGKLRDSVMHAHLSPTADPVETWTFLNEVIEEYGVELFYVNSNPIGYESMKPTGQVVVVAKGLLFDFVFGDGVQRYDVVLLKDLHRVEERREREQAVEGDPRHKVLVNFDFFATGFGVSELTLVAYGTDGEEVSRFTAAIRLLAFRGS